jgi:predicted RNA methylase
MLVSVDGEQIAATLSLSGAADPVARELRSEALTSGRRTLPARERAGYVRTPDSLADELCAWPHHDLRWLAPGARVLEPSAGDGALVAAILRCNPQVAVTAVEPHLIRAQACTDRTAASAADVTVHVGTFEQYAMTAARAGTRFDAVVMNPPFAIAGQADVWLEHLRTAWHLLRPGGRLVAVVPAGFAFRSSGIHADARAFVEHHGTHQSLPVDAFAETGAQVSARVVRMTKPVDGSLKEYLLAVDVGREPVPVSALRLAGAAAADTPAQVLRGGWDDGRVARYHGRCALCGWLLWGFDDGQNDPRGPLGEFSVGFSLHPQDYDTSGPPVGLCPDCGNTGARYHEALRRRTSTGARLAR